jgi:hypothetical protein
VHPYCRVLTQGSVSCVTRHRPRLSCYTAASVRWRRWIVDIPARVVDVVGFAYLLLLAAICVVLVVSVLLFLLAYLVGLPHLLATIAARR